MRKQNLIDWKYLHDKLIETKQVSEKGKGIERHHIIPKHDSGNNDESNLVYLPKRYHILIHYIRWRWKGQFGDLLSTNLLLKYKNSKITDELKQYISEKAIVRFSDPEARKRVSIHRKKFVDTLPNKRMLVERMLTPEAKAKAKISNKLFIKNNPEKIKERAIRGGLTTKMNNLTKTKEELAHIYGHPGIKNPRWGGYFLLIKDGFQYIFDDMKEIRKFTGMGERTLLDFANTDVPIFYDNVERSYKWEGWYVYRTKEPENVIWQQ